MKIRSVKNADLKNKTVLLRVDFNVPLKDGKVSDDTRIQASLPTIQYLLEQQAKVVIMTHLGRPKGQVVPSLKLDPLTHCISKALNRPVKKLDDCIGDDIKAKVSRMQPGDVTLLENTRFYKEEEACQDGFCQKIASLGDVFVIDSFGTAHRKHASTYGIAKYLPTYAGLLIEKEIKALSQLMQDTPKSLTVIMGGAKIDTKIGLMQNFLSRADNFLVGGGLANTFLAAQGFDVGESLYQKDKIELAQEIMLQAQALQSRFIVPQDAIVADEVSETAKTLDLPIRDIEGSMKILDIGQQTIQTFKEVIATAGTIIWNGPVGVFDKTPFSNGTKAVAHAIAESPATTIIGGGDTIEAIKHFGIATEAYTHVSTGGGAMLQFLEGSSLPGIEIVLEGQNLTKKAEARK